MFCTYVDHIFSKLGQRATESNEKKITCASVLFFYQINKGTYKKNLHIRHTNVPGCMIFAIA